MDHFPITSLHPSSQAHRAGTTMGPQPSSDASQLKVDLVRAAEHNRVPVPCRLQKRSLVTESPVKGSPLLPTLAREDQERGGWEQRVCKGWVVRKPQPLLAGPW
jgi:hypothetical protein